ncbi:MAG: hypothetical protein HC884_02315 [Chloroflexaceae bacterium]|nr:hypothetical protein [Chloroflexaceae bacterium]
MKNHLDEQPWRDPEDALDQVLRTELRWHAPPELTSRLIALAEHSPGVGRDPLRHGTGMAGLCPLSDATTALPPLRPQPGAWYSVLVMILTSMAVGVSFAVAWQLYGLVGAELGLSDVVARFQADLASGMQQVGEELPLVYQVLTLVGTLYRQVAWLLNWLFIAIILWLVLDGYTPGTTLQQQRTS